MEEKIIKFFKELLAILTLGIIAGIGVLLVLIPFARLFIESSCTIIK